MTEPQKLALNFFKRNPKAEVVHIVLDKVFIVAAHAMRFKISVNAKKITVVLRSELTKQLRKNGNRKAAEKQSTSET